MSSATVQTDELGYPLWHKQVDRIFKALSDPGDTDCLASDLQEAGMEEDADLELLLEPDLTAIDVASVTELLLRDRLDGLIALALRATKHFLDMKREDVGFDINVETHRLLSRWLCSYVGNLFCLDVLDRAGLLNVHARADDMYRGLCDASKSTTLVVTQHFPEALLAVIQEPYKEYKRHLLTTFLSHRCLAPKGAANKSFFRTEMAAQLSSISDELLSGGVDCVHEETGRTMLHRIVLSGAGSNQGQKVAAAALLLHMGADVSQADKHGHTPLSDAMRKEQLGVVLSVLMQYGRGTCVVDRGGVGVRQLARLTAEVRELRRALLRSKRETSTVLLAMGKMVMRLDKTQMGLQKERVRKSGGSRGGSGRGEGKHGADPTDTTNERTAEAFDTIDSDGADGASIAVAARPMFEGQHAHSGK